MCKWNIVQKQIYASILSTLCGDHDFLIGWTWVFFLDDIIICFICFEWLSLIIIYYVYGRLAEVRWKIKREKKERLKKEMRSVCVWGGGNEVLYKIEHEDLSM